MTGPEKQLGSILARRRNSLADAIASPDNALERSASFRPPSPTDAHFGRPRAQPAQAADDPGPGRSEHDGTPSATGNRTPPAARSTRRKRRETAAVIDGADDDPGQRFNLHLRGEILQDVLAVSVEMRRIPTKAIVTLLSEAVAARKRR